jgi:3-dehydrosphinganine reductase
MGVYGYAAYSSAKCALKGLAEVLEFELAPFGIRLSLCFPPDTATPGFEVGEIRG